jgi:hypothetical protein
MTGTIQEPCNVNVYGAIARDNLTTRVRGEYREMPGMRLTIEQAMRMWSLDRTTCSELFSSLVAAHFLERDRNGRYTKAHGGY